MHRQCAGGIETRRVSFNPVCRRFPSARNHERGTTKVADRVDFLAVGEAMRKLDEEGKLADLRKFLDQNPASVEQYAEVVLSRDFAASQRIWEFFRDKRLP